MIKQITKLFRVILNQLKEFIALIMKITRVIAKIIMTIIAVSLIVSLINTFLSADEVARENDRLLTEFKTIQHPVDSIVIDPKEKVSRGPLYTAEFRYILSDEEVENYYDQELKKYGWVKEAKKYDNDYKGFSYAKDRNVIAIFKTKNNIMIEGGWHISLYYQLRLK